MGIMVVRFKKTKICFALLNIILYRLLHIRWRKKWGERPPPVRHQTTRVDASRSIFRSPLRWHGGGSYAHAEPINRLLFVAWPRSTRMSMHREGDRVVQEGTVHCSNGHIHRHVSFVADGCHVIAAGSIVRFPFEFRFEFRSRNSNRFEFRLRF